MHPVVHVHIEGVKLRALIDTGSMKSFITDKVHAILDFDNARVRTETVRCMSITGNPLTILGSLEASVKFNRRATSIMTVCWGGIFW